MVIMCGTGKRGFKRMNISLVTSFYKGYDRFLDQWLSAVSSSTELPDEIIIGVSGDGYDPTNVQKAEERLSEVQHQIVYFPHVSMGQARNEAVKAASGNWIMYLNVDDEITPNAMHDIRQNLSEEMDILTGSMEWCGHPKKSGIRKYEITEESIISGGITNDHSIYRRSIWELSPYIEYSGDVDMAFWLGLVQAGAKIKCVDAVLTKHYFRPDSVFGKYSKEDMQEIRRQMAIWRKEGVHSERFNTPEYKSKGDYGFKHHTGG